MMFNALNFSRLAAASCFVHDLKGRWPTGLIPGNVTSKHPATPYPKSHGNGGVKAGSSHLPYKPPPTCEQGTIGFLAHCDPAGLTPSDVYVGEKEVRLDTLSPNCTHASPAKTRWPCWKH